ncbi:MAG: cellulase family glycosylhydrolase [Capsulimonadaceae bacterium]|nr:cellulase family glycosylhydrolase [Capsulimonadaceae bacterium]
MANFTRLNAYIFLICAVLSFAGRPAAAEPLKLSVVSIRAVADMADVTFSYGFKAVNRSANTALQLYVHRDDVTGEDRWEPVNPVDQDGRPLILHLFKGLTVTGSFALKLPAGKYGTFRLLLFAASDSKSIDFSNVLYDSAAGVPEGTRTTLALTITTSESRVVKPTIDIGLAEAVDRGIGKYEIVVPATVKIPASYTGSDEGFWAMAKGSAGTSQVWAAMKDARPGNEPRDPYRAIPVTFRIPDVSAGVWTLDFGLFAQAWGDPIQWRWHALDIETGGDSWVKQAPRETMPPRLHVVNRRFLTMDDKPFAFYSDGAATAAASFVRGGNYGNAICWNTFPDLNSPGYFVLLRDMGCHFIRFNFNPDRYAGEPLYQHAVDQVVQNILTAGIYPIIAPQDLPKADSLSLRIIRGLAVVRAMAKKYNGQSVWLEVCNEPKEFSTWQTWKPVAERYVREIRSIDPDAFVIVPFEGYSKDGRGAARDPITSVAVDLYDGHAYLSPEDIAVNFGPAIDAGLPVIAGEYGGDNAPYIHSVNRALQSLHGLMAAAPWAFTVQGQDSLPLIKDGASAELVYTDTGKSVAADYAAWDAGKRLE